MDPGILIPVTGYGGHERLVEMFAKEYQRLGHDVHLLITDGSYVENCTVYPFGKAGFPPQKKDARKAIFTAWIFLFRHRNSFDLIHNFGRLLYLLPVLNRSVKKIMTYGREITGGNVNRLLSLPTKNIVFTGCSTDLISRSGARGKWRTLYNAVEFSKYDFQENLPADAPLIFLGRIERVKGCHTAIAVAIEAGRKLLIAGNISPLADEKKYYDDMVAPFIDGQQIIYLGAVNDEQKSYWLGKSAALLFPIEWNEPFGIVMVEAMACGTPVIAFGKGSVKEVILNNITGFICNSKAEMVQKVGQLQEINRGDVRDQAGKKFSVGQIAQQYLSLFEDNK